MSRIVAFPYRTARAERVQVEPWVHSGMEGPEPLDAQLPGWDYNTNLRVGRQVLIDSAGVRADCGLGPDDPIALVAVWRSTGTILRGLGAGQRVPDGAPAQVRLEARLPSTSMGGTLVLQTRLILAAQRPGAGSLEPWVAGSVLWQDEVAVALEGIGSRFPVEVVDFEASGWLPPGAAWYLAWNSLELDEPFLGSVRLLVNAKNRRVAAAVQNPKHAASTLIASMMYFDVGRSLIRGTLASDEFTARPDQYREGSTGWAVHALLRALFPADSPLSLRGLMDQHPAEFDAQLQAALRLLEEAV